MDFLIVAALLIGGADDGWVTWRVEAGEDVGYWCCATWSAGKATTTSCQLEGGGVNINNDDPSFQATGEMQVYVKLEDGEAVTIRTLSPQCPVETEGDIRDLGLVATDQSLEWLNDQVGDKRRLSSDALLAISAHEGAQAVQALVSAVENRALEMKVREQALFWLANSGSDEAYAYLDQLLTNR